MLTVVFTVYRTPAEFSDNKSTGNPKTIDIQNQLDLAQRWHVYICRLSFNKAVLSKHARLTSLNLHARQALHFNKTAPNSIERKRHNKTAPILRHNKSDRL